MQIRIEGSDLPGRTCRGGGDFPGYENVHVGVQKRRKPDELLDRVPGDAATAVWTFDCEVVRGANGIDFKGPYIEGRRPGERFVYLSWGSIDDAGTFNMFRRAKLMLDAVDPTVVDAAECSGHLVARLGLSDARGHPLCAAVRPPKVEWSAT